MAKTDKICIVCGKGFQGTQKAEVCGGACRTKLSRMKVKDEQPTFRLVGGRNTGLKFQSAPEVPKKSKPTQSPKNGFKSKSKKSYDAPPTDTGIKDEPPKYESGYKKPFMNEAIRKKLGL